MWIVESTLLNTIKNMTSTGMKKGTLFVAIFFIVSSPLLTFLPLVFISLTFL